MNNDIDIILAGRKDACDFYKLEAKCFEMDENPDTLYFWVPILEYQYCYKAVYDDSLVGGIVSMPTRDKKWYINSLFVDPKYRRKKIASMLLEKLVDIAQCDIILDVKTDRPYLLKFYLDRGFKKEQLSVGHYYDGSDRFIMQKRGSKT